MRFTHTQQPVGRQRDSPAPHRPGIVRNTVHLGEQGIEKGYVLILALAAQLPRRIHDLRLLRLRRAAGQKRFQEHLWLQLRRAGLRRRRHLPSARRGKGASALQPGRLRGKPVNASRA